MEFATPANLSWNSQSLVWWVMENWLLDNSGGVHMFEYGSSKTLYNKKHI